MRVESRAELHLPRAKPPDLAGELVQPIRAGGERQELVVQRSELPLELLQLSIGLHQLLYLIQQRALEFRSLPGRILSDVHNELVERPVLGLARCAGSEDLQDYDSAERQAPA